MNLDDKPKLIEPGVKYFLNQTLKQCNVFKNKYNNIMFNLGMLTIFIFILVSMLLYKYKGKLTNSEKEIKNRDKQQYILSKIKIFQDAKLKLSQELITGLPEW
jgi:hypothetical protein